MRESKVLSLVVFVAILAAPCSLLAQPPADILAKPLALKPGAGSLSAVEAGPRAFFSLADAAVAPGPHELAFVVHVHGLLMFEEILGIAADAGDATFEILAGEPRTLDAVLAQGALAGRRSKLEVLLDGEVLRTFSVPEYLSYNEAFAGIPERLQSPLTQVRTYSPDVVALIGSSGMLRSLTKDYNPSCVASCDAQRDDCYQTEPECFGVEWCDLCEDQWSSCYAGCEICTDPKSVSYYSTAYVSGTTYSSTTCLENYWGSKTYYDIYSGFTITHNEYQRTEYCNGSIVDTFLYSWNENAGACMRNTYFPCSFSFGSAYGPFCPF